MYFLTFDTSLDKTYVTLFCDEKLEKTEIIESHDDKYHSAYLIQNLVNLLKNFNLTMQDIEAIGVNIGPGSFTGIRACLTIARVIAQQLEIPLVGVSSLEILAQINKNNNQTIVIMDARKNMCYFAHYDENKQVIKEPQLINIEDITLDKENCIVIVDKSMQEILDKEKIQTMCYTDVNDDLGKYLGELTYKMLMNNKEDYHWAKVKPLYLQKPSITLPKKQLI